LVQLGKNLSEYIFWPDENTHVTAYYNILKEPFKPDVPATEIQNTYLEPSFMPGSYELARTSIGIGLAEDSLEINGDGIMPRPMIFFG